MTRAHLIATGMVRFTEPRTANWFPNLGAQLNADELDARGFPIAAYHKRQREWGIEL